MISFKDLSLIMSVIAILLFAVLLLAPNLIFILFAVEGNESAYFLARRAALLFLGYALISFAARNAQASAARQAISVGIAVAMLSLAVLGLVELSRGYAGIGILLAISAELFIGLSYLFIWNKNQARAQSQS